MKLLSILSITGFFFLCTYVTVMAANNPEKATQILDQKQAEIDAELMQLDQLSNFIQSENITHKELLENKSFDISKLNLKSTTSSSEFVAQGSDKVLGIPGFIWGFCLGLIGILIVFIAMEEGPDRKKEVRSALLGCIVWTVLYVVLYSAGIFGDVTPIIKESMDVLPLVA